MMTYPIADFLIQIKNAYLARKEKIIISHSKMKESLAEVLLHEGYISGFKVKNEGKTNLYLELTLNYKNKRPALYEVAIVSKPGRRVYVGKDTIPKVLGGLGKVIISTSLGVMTGDEAKKKKVGGELICKIW